MSKQKRFVRLLHAPRYFPYKTTERSIRNWKSRGYYKDIKLFVKIGHGIYVDLKIVKEFLWDGQIDVNQKPLVRIKDSIKYFPTNDMTEKKLRGWRSREIYPGLFKKFAGTLYVDTRQIPGIIKAA